MQGVTLTLRPESKMRLVRAVHLQRRRAAHEPHSMEVIYVCVCIRCVSKCAIIHALQYVQVMYCVLVCVVSECTR